MFWLVYFSSKCKVVLENSNLTAHRMIHKTTTIDGFEDRVNVELAKLLQMLLVFTRNGCIKYTPRCVYWMKAQSKSQHEVSLRLLGKSFIVCPFLTILSQLPSLIARKQAPSFDSVRFVCCNPTAIADCLTNQCRIPTRFSLLSRQRCI